MMVFKNPQNGHRKYFWQILMTFICDVKIDINMCEPHYVNLFFLLTSSSCLTFWHFDIFVTAWLNTITNSLARPYNFGLKHIWQIHSSCTAYSRRMLEAKTLQEDGFSHLLTCPSHLNLKLSCLICFSNFCGYSIFVMLPNLYRLITSISTNF